MALSCISLIVRPSKLSVFIFIFSRSPAIADWCTTLHLLLQNVYFTLSPEGFRSTAQQDLLQSQIIMSLPRLRALHIQIRLPDRQIPFQVEFDHTVAALESLPYIRHLSLHTHQESTLYSMQILRKLADGITSLELGGGTLGWLFADDIRWSDGTLPFEGSNAVVHNRLKLPNLLFLDLSKVNYGWLARRILKEICFETSIHSLQINLHAVLSYPPQPVPHAFDRLILCERRSTFVHQTKYEEPRFPEGLAAGTVEFVILVEGFEDIGSRLLEEMLQTHLSFISTIPLGKVRKVVWRMELANTALRHQARETLQETVISSLLRSVEDVCGQNSLVWEMIQP